MDTSIGYSFSDLSILYDINNNANKIDQSDIEKKNNNENNIKECKKETTINNPILASTKENATYNTTNYNNDNNYPKNNKFYNNNNNSDIKNNNNDEILNEIKKDINITIEMNIDKNSKSNINNKDGSFMDIDKNKNKNISNKTSETNKLNISQILEERLSNIMPIMKKENLAVSIVENSKLHEVKEIEKEVNENKIELRIIDNDKTLKKDTKIKSSNEEDENEMFLGKKIKNLLRKKEMKDVIFIKIIIIIKYNIYLYVYIYLLLKMKNELIILMLYYYKLYILGKG